MHTTEPEVSEIQQAYAEGYKDGKKAKTKEIIEWASNRICFDNKNDGSCDHSACHELQNLLRELNKF
jgi:hypothetical protein